MTREAQDSSTSFPRWVALASLGLALWLFFANAVPAVRERAELETLSGDLEQLRQSYDTAIHEARLQGGGSNHPDLQSLLVAIDRLGLTPAELCTLHPEPPPAEPEAAPTAGRAPRKKFP